MEEYHQRFPFDVDKMTGGYIVSPMLLPTNFDHTKLKNKIENFESPIFTSASLLKSELQYQAGGNIPSSKEDDFSLDSSEIVRSDHHHSNHNLTIPTQLDISFDPVSSIKPQDQLFGFPQFARSRGTSFNLGRGRLGSEELFTGNYDPLAYYKNDEYHEKQPHTFKSEYQDAYLDHDFVLNQVTSSPNFLPRAPKQGMENNFSYVLQPLQLEKDNYHSEEKSNEILDKNQELQSTKNKTKKKRKLNNNEESFPQEKVEHFNPKLEVKKQMYSVTPTNSLKLKITKLGEIDDGKEPGKSKQKFSVKTENDFSVKIEKDLDKDEKSTEAPSSIHSCKVEDLNMVKSQSIPNFASHQLKKPENAREIFGSLGIPSEIEEYINNSGVLSHIPFHSTRKIGTLTVEERRIKIEKYLLKRKKRTWSKKISYDCRKRVADSRLRIKGRFVTKEQAFAMLGPDAIGLDFDKITTNEIKTLLLQKFGGSCTKKKDRTDKSFDMKKEDSESGDDGSKIDFNDLNEAL